MHDLHKLLVYFVAWLCYEMEVDYMLGAFHHGGGALKNEVRLYYIRLSDRCR